MGTAGEAATDEQVLNMFESKEEVERTMLALKIFPDIGHVGDVEQEEPDTDKEEYAPQVFPEHTAAEPRYTRSLYYGALPATDRPSLPLTRLAVDQFTSSGLDALGQKLGRLDMARAADISRQACAGPNSLVLALLSQAWRGSEAWREERSALHQLGLQAPKPGLQYRGRCPVLRWGSTTLRWGSVAAWPLLLTPG